MWLTLILRNWQLAVIASLGVALMLSMTLGRMWKAERDEKIAVIESMKREAQSYKERSETIAKETGDAFNTLVEQIKAKDTALQKARTRFGTCASVRGVFPDWMLRHKDGVGETDVPEGTCELSLDERIPVDRAFVDTCATDAAFVRSVHEWRIANQLEVK